MLSQLCKSRVYGVYFCGSGLYTQNGWNDSREGVSVLPGTLLHCLRPERVTLQMRQDEQILDYQSLTNLMQEGGRTEPIVLRLPYRKEAPARLELASPSLVGRRSVRLSYGAY